MAGWFRSLVEDRLTETTASPITAARRHGLARDAIRSVLRGRVPSVEAASEICQALGLELRIGPPGAVPEAIVAALGLPADATVDDVLAAIEARTAPAAAVAAPPSQSPAPPSTPSAATGLEPLHDRTLAEMVASMADAWEGADADGREDLRLRWQASFPDLARRALSLSGPRLSRLAGGGGRRRRG